MHALSLLAEMIIKTKLSTVIHIVPHLEIHVVLRVGMKFHVKLHDAQILFCRSSVTPLPSWVHTGCSLIWRLSAQCPSSNNRAKAVTPFMD